MALMMILMVVVFVVQGPGFHHMGSHEAPGMTTQAHQRDAANSDPREHMGTHEGPGMIIQSPEHDAAKSNPRQP